MSVEGIWLLFADLITSSKVRERVAAGDPYPSVALEEIAFYGFNLDETDIAAVTAATAAENVTLTTFAQAMIDYSVERYGE